MKPCHRELVALRNDAPPHAPVFRSRGGAYGKSSSSLDPSQVARIVEAAACRAVIAVHTETIIVDGKQVQRKRSLVSHHWMRHAHASHALDNKEDKEMKPSEEFDDYWIRAQNEHMDYPASDDWRSGK